MKSFVETVRRKKAIEHLIRNDALFHAIAYRMSTGSAVEAVWIALESAAVLADKVKNIEPQMDVSEKEKREGYRPSI